MNSDDIQKWQAAKIRDALYKPTNDMARLRRRMEKRGFPPADPFYQSVSKAYDAMVDLGMKAHYLSCNGVAAPASLGAELPQMGEDDMCGRYVHYHSWAHLRATLTFTPFPAEVPPNYNVAPTHQVPVVRNLDGKREGVLLRWGLIPSWAKDKKAMQINARGEGVATKPMFRAAFKKRRCLIVADGYYEWKKEGKTRHPFLFRLKDDQAFAFAGLWEHWEHDGEVIDSCAIITTAANDLARAVHDRMPVLLAPDAWEPWLDDAVDAAAGEAARAISG
jgi:putative SOS response-associated peptidase YedK